MRALFRTTYGPALLLSLLSSSAASADIPVTWSQLEGGATDLAIGAEGSVWIIGTLPEPNSSEGNSIYRRTPGSTTWEKVAGAGRRIAVDPHGNAWVVNKSGNIFRWEGSGFRQVNGGATDIAIGSDGSMWIVGTIAEGTQGFSIYRADFATSTWLKVPGAGTRIAVDSGGAAWVVNAQGAVYRWNGSAFAPVESPPGGATDLAIGNDLLVFSVGGCAGGSCRAHVLDIYGQWEPLPGSARAIASGSNGTLWIADANGQLWTGPSPQALLDASYCCRSYDSQTRRGVGCYKIVGVPIYKDGQEFWCHRVLGYSTIECSDNGTVLYGNGDLECR